MRKSYFFSSLLGLLQPWERISVSISTLKEFANAVGVEYFGVEVTQG
jgi:hypothetical protein